MPASRRAPSCPSTAAIQPLCSTSPTRFSPGAKLTAPPPADDAIGSRTSRPSPSSVPLPASHAAGSSTPTIM
ncbi:hypothetical protein HH800_04290 [Sphingobium yanoikuyae]|uniref:Uncharacterized protein n=1 Tax=Sphingobium yanoikuyae TaxID=13690 RepID=A0A6M4G770_SPHYA|nr:hypothetical protein [Sphingobium yanoikuyae]QJR01487.1 hypothetical protein HH800_04290 [Sphingobium yanoikuyae]